MLLSTITEGIQRNIGNKEAVGIVVECYRQVFFSIKTASILVVKGIVVRPKWNLRYAGP